MSTPMLVSLCVRFPRLYILLSKYVAWENARKRRNHKCLWRCYRDGGGGKLITPKPMTEDGAVAWINRVTKGEVFHVDFDNRMIFYRSAGQTRLTD